MPCGGVYPTILTQPEPCFVCEKIMDEVLVLAVEEWDAAIHVGCLRSFLGSQEAQVIVDHQHPIITSQNKEGFYCRLLCYSPELSCSDWAICHIDQEGNEVVDESYSRVEYLP